MVKIEFERMRYSADGKSSERETASVEIEVPRDIEGEVMRRAFLALFAKHPEWATGHPVRDGIGWSSALIVQPPR